MPSLLGRDYITFAEAAQLIPGRPHLNTVRRWADRGLHGIRMDSWWAGGKRITSVEAIEKFILATSNQQAAKAPSAAATTAEAKLDALGIK